MTPSDPHCPFCRILAGQAPADLVYDGPHALGIIPLRPVTPGHVLFLPRLHVPDALTAARVTADTIRAAVEWTQLTAAQDSRYASVNIITSVGVPATQTVEHLHWHVVPRTPGDGLTLPWTGQDTTEGEQRTI